MRRPVHVTVSCDRRLVRASLLLLRGRCLLPVRKMAGRHQPVDLLSHRSTPRYPYVLVVGELGFLNHYQRADSTELGAVYPLNHSLFVSTAHVPLSASAPLIPFSF